jgi:hypothetical protein
MRTLVIGESGEQLTKWRDRSFSQSAVINAAAGTVKIHDREYVLIVSKPNDDRIRGQEFHQLIILKGAVDHGGQYSMRVRPNGTHTFGKGREPKTKGQMG